MSKRFASYLIASNAAAAALPLFAGDAAAQVTPTYTDILNSGVTVIEMPTSGVKLNSIYGTSSSGAASVCSTSVPTTMSIVVTGGQAGDTLYLVAALDSDNASFLALSPSFRIGTKNLVVLAKTLLPTVSTSAGAVAATMPINIPVSTDFLKQNGYTFAAGTKMYLQAALMPASALDANGGVTDWTKIRFSELDEIQVISGTTSQYGSYGSYGC